MPLTLNQFLLLIITIAAVVAVTYLVILFSQLRKTAQKGEQALSEITELASSLKETNRNLNMKIDDVGEILENAKNAASRLGEITGFVTMRMIRPSSKYWPILYPLARFGWRQWKKRKRQKEE